MVAELAFESNFARELWRRLESLHAVTYFAPESVEAARSIGVNGFWRTYFGFRAAPMGQCSAGAAQAAFFGFAPEMVSRAIPGVWDLASPVTFLEARAASAAAALRRVAGTEVERLASDDATVSVLQGAVERASAGGLPLFLSNCEVVPGDDPVARVWQLATTLREHRGDGHVASWTARGFSPIEVAVLFVASGGSSREALQPNRGWTDDEWADTIERGRRRGLLTAEHRLTDAGFGVVGDVESATDRLAEAPFAALDAQGRAHLLAALEPAARAIARSEMIPRVNPMGVPLLDNEHVGDGPKP